MIHRIEVIKARVEKRKEKIKVLKKGLKICTLNKEKIRCRIEKLKESNRKAQKKIKEIEYLFTNFGNQDGCDKLNIVEESQDQCDNEDGTTTTDPSTFVPEPIEGCKRVESLDSRFVKRAEKIRELRRVIAENRGKRDTTRLESKLRDLVEAQDKALYIRDKIECEFKPESPADSTSTSSTSTTPEPEIVVEETCEEKIDTIRTRIAGRKEKIAELRVLYHKHPTTQRQERIERLESKNERDFVRLGGFLKEKRVRENPQ